MSMTHRIADDPELTGLLLTVVKEQGINENPVTDSVSSNLVESYAKRYRKPKSDSEAIKLLAEAFKDLMDLDYLTLEIKDGIGEYYRILSNRGLPAFEWMLEAFHVASKKDDNKRNFRYVCGMLRYWMKYGFGHIPSQEEEEVVSYFEEVTNTEATAQTRLLIQNLMGTYGAIKVTRMISFLERGNDKSYLMAQVLKHQLEEKFSDSSICMDAS